MDLVEVKVAINRLIGLAEHARDHHLPALGSGRPGVLLVIAGPRGVGKSTIAGQIGPLLFELGRLCQRAPVYLSPTSVSDAKPGALCLIEHADWLTQMDDQVYQTGFAWQHFSTLAKANPYQFYLGLELSREGLLRLDRMMETAPALATFHIHRLELPAYEPDTLARLLRQKMNGKVEVCKDDADQVYDDLSRKLRRRRQRLGDQFRYGHEVDELVEPLIEEYQTRHPRCITADECRALTEGFDY